VRCAEECLDFGDKVLCRAAGNSRLSQPAILLENISGGLIAIKADPGCKTLFRSAGLRVKKVVLRNNINSKSAILKT